ncbi:MAG: hypothetical protein J7K40_10295, partial [candidate division Zixibacteria bacterium]|nr:hypothetical protein [candidate division Zixibacteria bacterium]
MTEDSVQDRSNADTCWAAMKAVQENLRRSCGMGTTIKLGPVTIDVPETIIHIINETESVSNIRDKQIDAIIDTNWCKETAEAMYSSMSVFEHDSPSYFLGLANVEWTIAEAVVDEIGQ